MFDTMTITKAFGALCGSLLVFLVIGLAGGAIFHTGGEGHGAEVAQAYTIDTGAAAGGDATATADAGPAFDEVFAAADPAAGEKVFAKCKSCHKVDGQNATGPHLNGVVNRVKASVDGFAYSEAMAAHKGENWTPEEMNGFITNPKGYVPGTKMSFAGLPDVKDRANVIAWLATQQ